MKKIIIIVAACTTLLIHSSDRKNELNNINCGGMLASLCGIIIGAGIHEVNTYVGYVSQDAPTGAYSSVDFGSIAAHNLEVDLKESEQEFAAYVPYIANTITGVSACCLVYSLYGCPGASCFNDCYCCPFPEKED